jgi:hypothetical protein
MEDAHDMIIEKGFKKRPKKVLDFLFCGLNSYPK